MSSCSKSLLSNETYLGIARSVASLNPKPPHHARDAVQLTSQGFPPQAQYTADVEHDVALHVGSHVWYCLRNGGLQASCDSRAIVRT